MTLHGNGLSQQSWSTLCVRCQRRRATRRGRAPALATLEGCEDLLAKCTAKCTPLQLTAGTYLLELSLNGGAVYTTDQQELIVFDARGDQATSSVPSLERSDVQVALDGLPGGAGDVPLWCRVISHGTGVLGGTHTGAFTHVDGAPGVPRVGTCSLPLLAVGTGELTLSYDNVTWTKPIIFEVFASPHIVAACPRVLSTFPAHHELAIGEHENNGRATYVFGTHFASDVACASREAGGALEAADVGVGARVRTRAMELLWQRSGLPGMNSSTTGTAAVADGTAVRAQPPQARRACHPHPPPPPPPPQHTHRRQPPPTPHHPRSILPPPFHPLTSNLPQVVLAMRGAGGGFGGGATAELDPRRAAHVLVRAVRQVGVGQAEGIRACRSRLLAEYPSRGGGRRDRCPPRAAVCISTPTYGLYYSQHSVLGSRTWVGSGQVGCP